MSTDRDQPMRKDLNAQTEQIKQHGLVDSKGYSDTRQDGAEKRQRNRGVVEGGKGIMQ